MASNGFFVRGFCLVIAMLGVGCATSQGGEPNKGNGPCVGKCDDGAAVAPTLSCWVEAHPEAKTDSVLCELGALPAGAAFTATATVQTEDASGNNAGATFLSPGVQTVANVVQGRYPVNLDVKLLVTSSALGIGTGSNPGHIDLLRSVQLKAATDATKATPLVMDSPLEFWSVTITTPPDSRFEFVLEDYAADVAPFTLMDTSSSLLLKQVQSQQPKGVTTTYVFVAPTGATSLIGTGTAAKLGTIFVKGETATYPIALEAGGDYTASLEGLEPMLGTDADAGQDDGGSDTDATVVGDDAGTKEGPPQGI